MENNKNQNFKPIINYIYPIIIILIIVFGIFIRTKLYLFKVEFWLDEVMIALSYIDKGIGALFLPLEAQQKAPPIFLCLVYFIVKLFGFNELAFRLIPYISGCLSMVLFYFLLNSYVKDKIGKITGLFLFAVSLPLLYNSAEFKPYSSDVLICILLLLFFNRFSSKDIVIAGGKIKQIIIYTLIPILLIFFSFPASFIIFAMIITKCIFEKKITLPSICMFIGIIISVGYVYFSDMNLYPFMRNFWWLGGRKSITFMLLESILYFMNNNSYTVILYYFIIFIIFILLGFIILYKEKKQTAVMIFFCIYFPFCASILNLYPFEGRLILFLIPIIFLLIAKIFDYNIFQFSKSKYQIIPKLFLFLLALIITNMRIPYINFPQEKIVNYTRYGDFKRSISYRQGMKNISLYVLNNYNKSIKIISSNEFYYFIKYYKKYYNKTNDVPITYIGWANNSTLKNIMSEFLDKNTGKYTMWFIGRNNENYFQTWSWVVLEKMLKQRNLNYSIINETEGGITYILSIEK